MIVTCAACKTRYLTDPTALGQNGRMVRCAKCSHVWWQIPPADMPRRVDVLPPLPDGPSELPPPRFNLPARYVPPRRRRRGARVAAAVAAGILLLAGAGWLGRERIMQTWPQAARVFELIGGMVAGPTSTLDVGNVQVVRQPVDGVDVLVLQGEIVNHSAQPQAVPALRATLLDVNDKGVMDWTFPSGHAILQPGETARFRTEAINPPKAFDRPSVTFVNDNGG